MKTILFRDKTAALDITSVVSKAFWDNTKPARDMVSGDKVFITPTRGNYKTMKEWLNAPAIWAYAITSDSVQLEVEEAIWPSGKGGYVHRHSLSAPLEVQVKDLKWIDEEAYASLIDWRQGAVRYVHTERGIILE